MPLYTQTLDGIPKQFLINQRKPAPAAQQEKPPGPLSAGDVAFAAAMLLLMKGEPYFSGDEGQEE